MTTATLSPDTGAAPEAPGHNQFALLKQRRFAPFFWTQFLGAGNDNLFKFAFTVLVTYQLQVSWLEPKMAGLVIGLKQAGDREESGKAVIEGKEIYLLQAGSFQNPADADNMKAKLALLGLEANVEATNIPDKGVMYRVRLGPFEKIEEINRVRSQLAQNGIEPSLVRVRDSKN